MIKAQITLENDTIDYIRAALEYFSGNNGKSIAPNTAKAFNQATRSVQRAWQNWARGGSLDGAADIKSASPKLASSIKVNQMSDFSAEVYTESPYMSQIQEGRKAQDMKLTYPFGRKSRVSKKRIPYLIIPFRWGTPTKSGINRAHMGNALTQEAYNIVRAFAKSKRTGGTHLEENAMGIGVERSEYEWGDRFESDDNMNGLVSMYEETNHGGGNIGSTYFTFRVISMNSKPESWWKKAIPPNDVVGALARATEKEVNDLLQAGLEADLDI